MAIKEHIDIFLKSDAKEWNKWVSEKKVIDSDFRPDLSDTNLSRKNLDGFNLTGALLTNAQMINSCLHNADLFGADLSNANLTKASIVKTYLDNSNCSKANFSLAKIDNCSSMGTNFEGARFFKTKFIKFHSPIGTDFTKASFVSTSFKDTDFCEAKLCNSYFIKTNLSEMDFTAADISGATFQLSDLTKAIFKKVNLSKANLSNIDASGAKFSFANMRESNLEGANVSKTLFVGTDLSNSRLININFHKAILVAANLTGSNLIDANFKDAKLTGANLSKTNLSGANLAGAKLLAADFSWANLRTAKGIRLDGTIIKNTQFSLKPIDPWSILRQKYTGPMFIFHIIFLLMFVGGYLSHAIMWKGFNILQQNIVSGQEQLLSVTSTLESDLKNKLPINIPLKILTPCFAERCDDPRPLWQVLLNIHKGWLSAILAASLITYNIIRGYLTKIISLMRDYEERSNRSPSLDDYLKFYQIHYWVMNPLFLIALSSLLFNGVEFLFDTTVILPSF